MRVFRRACMTCAHLYDDGKCHRFPPSVPVFEVSYNGVTHYPKASKDGCAELDFPTVDEISVCGEYTERTVSEPYHVMTYAEAALLVLDASERGE